MKIVIYVNNSPSDHWDYVDDMDFEILRIRENDRKINYEILSETSAGRRKDEIFHPRTHVQCTVKFTESGENVEWNVTRRRFQSCKLLSPQTVHENVSVNRQMRDKDDQNWFSSYFLQDVPPGKRMFRGNFPVFPRAQIFSFFMLTTSRSSSIPNSRAYFSPSDMVASQEIENERRRRP